FHPGSPIVPALPNEFLRRALIGVAMGLTAITIVYSPFGRRSGAHCNPAVTLTFLRLGPVPIWDAVFYTVAQIVGSIVGVAVVSLVARRWLSHPAVNYVATVPGPRGIWAAVVAEFVIAFLLMTTVLNVSSTVRLAPFTGLFAGTLVATFITFESPLSG